MRILGIDYGVKHVGIAYSEGIYAYGLKYVPKKEAVSQIQTLCQNLKITKVVIGNPEGRLENPVKIFAKQLTDFVEVDLWDETLSSQKAQQILIQNQVTKSRRQKQGHILSAIVILQSYLDDKKSAS